MPPEGRGLRSPILAVRFLGVVAAVAMALAPFAGQARPNTNRLPVHRASVAAATSISLFAKTSSDTVRRTAGAKPFLPTGSRHHVAAPARSTALPNTAASPALSQLATLPLDSFDAQVAQFGIDQGAEPPDTMLAAGPTALIETVNSTASIWTKTGTRTAFADFNKALPMPAGFTFSDPRILYDTISGRWFFTGLGFSLQYNSLVFLGVSKASDPAGGWFIYKIAQTSNGQLHDQPKVGVSDDKVVISWNDFCCGILGTFRGAETFVLEKSTLLTGAVTPVYFVGPTPSQSSPVPAQSMTSTPIELVTYNGTTFAGVLEISGHPAANNVVIAETDLPIPATSAPPAATQPGGTVETNDDRFLSSVWQNGNLWVSGNDSCVPAGSTTARACLRLIQISAITTGGMLPSLTQSLDVGKVGLDAYYPAVALDASQNLFVAFSISSSSNFPAAAALDILSSAPQGSVSGAAVFEAGAKTYGGTRWGDYSAAAVDPVSGAVWVTAEYSASGSSRDWGTATSELTP